MKTSELVLAARDHIKARGWVQGHHGWQCRFWPDAGLCVEGGLMAALGLDYADHNFDVFTSLERHAAYRAVRDYLGIHPSAWNDIEARSPQDVYDVLEIVALQESVKEQAEELVAA